MAVPEEDVLSVYHRVGRGPEYEPVARLVDRVAKHLGLEETDESELKLCVVSVRRALRQQEEAAGPKTLVGQLTEAEKNLGA